VFNPKEQFKYVRYVDYRSGNLGMTALVTALGEAKERMASLASLAEEGWANSL
jgi:hypothetical protein